MKKFYLRLVEAPRRKAVCEKEMRYEIHSEEKRIADVFYNMRGYCVNPGIPYSDGSFLRLPECSLSQIRKEIAASNREHKRVMRLITPEVVKRVFNCKEVEIHNNGIWITIPQSGHWLTLEETIRLIKFASELK